MKKYFLSTCTVVSMFAILIVGEKTGYYDWVTRLTGLKKALMGNFIPGVCLLLIYIVIDRATIQWRTSPKSSKM